MLVVVTELAVSVSPHSQCHTEISPGTETETETSNAVTGIIVRKGVTRATIIDVETETTAHTAARGIAPEIVNATVRGGETARGQGRTREMRALGDGVGKKTEQEKEDLALALRTLDATVTKIIIVVEAGHHPRPLPLLAPPVQRHRIPNLVPMKKGRGDGGSVRRRSVDEIGRKNEPRRSVNEIKRRKRYCIIPSLPEQGTILILARRLAP
jgi:hypothetical protein